jgi:hypothetical protein
MSSEVIHASVRIPFLFLRLSGIPLYIFTTFYSSTQLLMVTGLVPKFVTNLLWPRVYKDVCGFVRMCLTGVQTLGLVLAKVVLYHLSHTPSLFAFSLPFRYGFELNLLGLASNHNPPTSTSPVAEMIVCTTTPSLQGLFGTLLSIIWVYIKKWGCCII